MNKHYFHFTLGPVQSFVAQARRTRDFWAGSFILSWLSAVAMKAVKHQGGRIHFPAADDHFLDWLIGERTGKAPTQGSVPNRFMAEIDLNQFDSAQVSESVMTAWQALAATIYKHDLEGRVNETTLAIWDRQIRHFWEISWIITECPGESSALDQRKNWRSHLPPDEPGVKCMMMDGWQELSGEPNPHSDTISTFWENIRNNSQTAINTDLRPREHLCAIGYIKRRFPHYFQNVTATMPGGWLLRGWKVPTGMPSVAYMAVAHWLAGAIEHAHQDSKIELKLWGFHNAAHDLTREYGEWDTNLKCIRDTKPHRKWKALDGDVFFESTLDNRNIYPDEQQANKVKRKLTALRQCLNQKPVSPFYAVLLMDGDSLGKHMSDEAKQQPITQGLKDFTNAVSDIVDSHSGHLIYAGGDDVLAILPLEDAIPCAVDLRNRYLACFPDRKHLPTTLSGAIEYAHVRVPLTKVLKDAHFLLDDVAKEGRGRDALAIRVWKPGGQVVEWAQPWLHALEADNKRLVITRLAETLIHDDDDLGQLSNRFFYKIRDRFNLLNETPAQRKFRLASKKNSGTEPHSEPKPQFCLGEDESIDLMAAEYLGSGLCDKHFAANKGMDHARAVVRPLLEQCRPVYRDENQQDPQQWRRDDNLYADGAMLLRFLAQKGVER